MCCGSLHIFASTSPRFLKILLSYTSTRTHCPIIFPRLCPRSPPPMHIPLMRFPLREYFCLQSRWNGSVSHRGCSSSQRCRGLPLTCRPSSASLRACALTASASRSIVRCPCPRGGQKVECQHFSPEVRAVSRGQSSVGFAMPALLPDSCF